MSGSQSANHIQDSKIYDKSNNISYCVLNIATTTIETDLVKPIQMTQLGLEKWKPTY
jgi:hypothetical protein